MLKEQIIMAQSNDNDTMLELTNQFQPLLKKQAWILGTEDAYFDLLADFIALIRKIPIHTMENDTDAGIVTYISRSISNCSKHRRRQLANRKMEIVMTDLSDEQAYYVECIAATGKTGDIFLELNLSKLLTARELNVLHLIFRKGYSARDIADMYRLSRQTINQTKMRALNKIRKTNP